ncbi:MAG: hypothetical protein PF904_11590, partial [Kiritimatiellae bacterium]|nr:hypothetical protein [Kiritimatiellia bacterium]
MLCAEFGCASNSEMWNVESGMWKVVSGPDIGCHFGKENTKVNKNGTQYSEAFKQQVVDAIAKG